MLHLRGLILSANHGVDTVGAAGTGFAMFFEGFTNSTSTLTLGWV